jgi:membrane protease YdiL (CAAX protease family)
MFPTLTIAAHLIQTVLVLFAPFVAAFARERYERIAIRTALVFALLFAPRVAFDFWRALGGAEQGLEAVRVWAKASGRLCEIGLTISATLLLGRGRFATFFPVLTRRAPWAQVLVGVPFLLAELAAEEVLRPYRGSPDARIVGAGLALIPPTPDVLPDPAWMLVLTTITTLAYVVHEEVVFRGLVRSGLERRIGIPFAFLGASLLWSFLHFMPDAPPTVARAGLFVAVGFTYGVVAKRWGLEACMLWHLAHNLIR